MKKIILLILLTFSQIKTADINLETGQIEQIENNPAQNNEQTCKTRCEQFCIRNDAALTKCYFTLIGIALLLKYYWLLFKVDCSFWDSSLL